MYRRISIRPGESVLVVALDMGVQANEFLIDRENSKQHLSFGWGPHSRMGSRFEEMQLRILWEELLARFEHIEVLGEPERVESNFVMGYRDLQVVLHPR